MHSLPARSLRRAFRSLLLQLVAFPILFSVVIHHCSHSAIVDCLLVALDGKLVKTKEKVQLAPIQSDEKQPIVLSL